MEFKGTKDKWVLISNEYGYYTSVRSLDDTRKVCISRVNNQIESNANMLLISKAPEMLEMLQRILKDNVIPHLDIAELIKQATEI